MSVLLEAGASDRVGPAGPASEADLAVLRTVLYAGLFQFPLTLDELQRGLMDLRLDREDVCARLARPFLRERLAVTDGLVHPRGQEAWVGLRSQRRLHTEALLGRHARFLRRLGAFPFVRLAALSGSCAHGNAADEDIDIFLVVRRGRAWSVALALMLASKLAGLRRTLCINYIVDEEAVALPEQDLFTASEIVGMRPLTGGAGYERFLDANSWAIGFFPNFFAQDGPQRGPIPEAGAAGWLETLLGTAAPCIEAFSRVVLGRYLSRKTRGKPGVVLTPHRLKLHTEDHRPRLSAAFEAALREAL